MDRHTDNPSRGFGMRTLERTIHAYAKLKDFSTSCEELTVTVQWVVKALWDLKQRFRCPLQAPHKSLSTFAFTDV